MRKLSGYGEQLQEKQVGPSGLRKTTLETNSLAHRMTWLKCQVKKGVNIKDLEGKGDDW